MDLFVAFSGCGTAFEISRSSTISTSGSSGPARGGVRRQWMATSCDVFRLSATGGWQDRMMQVGMDRYVDVCVNAY
jgi:hypothetical protein